MRREVLNDMRAFKAKHSPGRAVAALAVLAMAAASGCATAGAADLRVGLASEPSSLDPLYHNLTPNIGLRMHIFQSLITQDAQHRLQPELAESWRTVNDTTWEFKLRSGVKWHDGTPFTAQDVIYTICRVPQVANSPSSFGIYTKSIEGMEAPDPQTLIIRTAEPAPLLPAELSIVGIVQAKAAGGQSVGFVKSGCKAESWPTSAQYNDGSLAVGTGPYKFKEYIKGDRIVLTRNPSYWGQAPDWDNVVFRPITNDGARVAALLAGDVDLIEAPPIQDLERLRGNPKLAVAQALSNRTMYVALSQQEPPPTIQGTDGRNPLKDRRVREAMSLAIDRDALVKRIMLGAAEPASQLIATGLFGNDPTLKLTHDQKKAKELLAAAGYPNGFQLTIGTPNDRYINDERVAQAIAQMYSRIGIKTQVDASTASVFFTRRTKGEFSVFLAGWAAQTGEASSPLKSLVATRIKDKGFGSTNFTDYSNKAVDDALSAALMTVDDAKRSALLKQSMRAAIEDFGIVPLYYEISSWAMRKDLSYPGRADQYTLAHQVRPQGK